jgi:hypothetical protein
LSDVLRYLSQQSRQNDPKGKGVNFMINPNPDASAAPAGFVVPVTPFSPAGSGQTNMGTFLVTIDPPLTNAPVGEVLDAVVRGASEPIYYSIQDFAVVFSPGKSSSLLYSRTFKVDTNTIINGLRRSSGLQTNNIPPSFGSISVRMV